MARLLELFDAATSAINVARKAAIDLDTEMAKSKEEVHRMNDMKKAYDELSAKLSKVSNELGEVNAKVEAAKELRKQLTELRHNS